MIINIREHKKVIISWESGDEKPVLYALRWWFQVCKWYAILLFAVIAIIFLHGIVFPEAEERLIYIVSIGMCIFLWPFK